MAAADGYDHFHAERPISRWIGQRRSQPHEAFTTIHGILLLLVLAFYLGYFGAGAGILLLATLAPWAWTTFTR